MIWGFMDGLDDGAWMQHSDEDPGSNCQIIQLQESSTFRVNNLSKRFPCKLSGDGKLMMVMNGGGKCRWCVGCDRGHGQQNLVGGILRSVCIRIRDYAHTSCGLTTAFEKRPTETDATLTLGVVGVQQIATDFADIWCMLLADVNHVATGDRLFQTTTKAG